VRTSGSRVAQRFGNRTARAVLLLSMLLWSVGCSRERDERPSRESQAARSTVAPSPGASVTRDTADHPAYPIVEARSGHLLGGAKAGRWIQATEMAGLMSGGERYRLYDLFEMRGEATGAAPRPAEAPCSSWKVEITPVLGDEGPLLAVAGSWDALPRKPRSQSLDQETYRQVVADRLRANRIRNVSVRLTQIFRIDLDGDGVDEVLLSASNLDPRSPDAPPNGYSVVLARWVTGTTPVTVPVEESYYPEGCKFCGPAVASVAAMLDLNGDGLQEVTVASHAYEGNSLEIVALRTAATERVLAWSCGA
jgi:hypothetical protein